MHRSSLILMAKFFKIYSKPSDTVLEIGSRVAQKQQVYMKGLGLKNPYKGMDIQSGPNVDIVVRDQYKWDEIESDSFDVVISGQAFEHIEFFWVTFREMVRVVKPDGYICIIAPKLCKQHRFPVDCWRFLPDGMRALARWGGVKCVGTQAEHESYNRVPVTPNDCIGIFKKTTSVTRANIINRLIERNGYERYLEIGVDNSAKNFDLIKCKVKVGVDPNVDCTQRMTSDEFFKKPSQDFDIVFIDGLHTAEQSERDILNSLLLLGPQGTIIVHDCNPISYKDESVDYSGEVWQTWAKFRMTRADLSMYVVDIDKGIGVIQKGKQTLFKMNGEDLNYWFMDEHRKELLNLISFEDFESWKT